MVDNIRTIEESDNNLKVIGASENVNFNLLTCYYCGGKGHISKNCFRKASNSSVTCFTCHKQGHIARDCDQNRRSKPTNEGSLTPTLMCGFCGTNGHPMMRCPDFIKFQRTLKDNVSMTSVHDRGGNSDRSDF